MLIICLLDSIRAKLQVPSHTPQESGFPWLFWVVGGKECSGSVVLSPAQQATPPPCRPACAGGQIPRLSLFPQMRRDNYRANHWQECQDKPNPLLAVGDGETSLGPNPRTQPAGMCTQQRECRPRWVWRGSRRCRSASTGTAENQHSTSQRLTPEQLHSKEDERTVPTCTPPHPVCPVLTS